LINIVNMSRRTWLSSREALALLDVRPQTLYANVSRKRIRVKPDPDDPRRSLYHVGDVQRLATRGRGRPNNERVAAESIAWGSPILASGISTVAHGRLWYRGEDAVHLAERESLETVAALLWQSAPIPFCANTCRRVRRADALTPLDAAYDLLASRAARDPPMYGRALSLLQAEAAELFTDLSDALIAAIERKTSARRKRPGKQRAQREPATAQLHVRLACAWRRPGAADLIRRALVLLADHELNASTFAARVAASTGAPLSACTLAAFATLSGPLHGAAALAILGLVDAANRAGAESAIADSQARGHPIPAFGHPLYPDGDVRALALLRSLNPPPVFKDLWANAERLIGEPPNVDFALAALAVTARLPTDAPFVLFALARSVGWIAHALEQSQSAGLIRPRARYVGPPIPAPRPASTST